ncbi:hypothetical protein EWH70_06290 [Amycolatopsis suaedae]|uniref:Uncharacterized protein n=1 Tax=Amycolatopsis suaedae TaxID=2510978 RepID=A0A4Q7JC63_9PSEU|nr:hypothetical protein EWH70_06290 [Amycolatopsis suaedae]
MKQVRGLIGVASAVGGAVSAASAVRAAKGKNDKLLLANAIASAAAALTGVLLAVRRFRKDEK